MIFSNFDWKVLDSLLAWLSWFELLAIIDLFSAVRVIHYKISSTWRHKNQPALAQYWLIVASPDPAWVTIGGEQRRQNVICRLGGSKLGLWHLQSWRWTLASHWPTSTWDRAVVGVGQEDQSYCRLHPSPHLICPSDTWQPHSDQRYKPMIDLLLYWGIFRNISQKYYFLWAQSWWQEIFKWFLYTYIYFL